MSDFLERLNKEKAELDIRIEKLSTFINSSKFEDIDDCNQSLLVHQITIMKSYSWCLNERLKLLNKSS